MQGEKSQNYPKTLLLYFSYIFYGGYERETEKLRKTFLEAYLYTPPYNYPIDPQNILKTVNIHLLKIRKDGEDSVKASMYYKGTKSK